MKPTCLLCALTLLHLAPALRAEDDLSHHRAVFSDINDHEKSYKKVKATHKDDDLLWELEGYFDGTQLRKILATAPGEDGDGGDDYYLEDGKLLFVFNHYRNINQDSGKITGTYENRLYFKDGKLFKWLGTDKKPIDPNSEEFKNEGQRLTGNFAHFLTAFKITPKPATKPAKDAVLIQNTEGIFTGIEEGDYTHWNMKDTKGQELSFFVIKPDASVTKVLDNPKAFKGKRCRIQWKQYTEKIPEAGGELQIESILSVEWLGKK